MREGGLDEIDKHVRAAVFGPDFIPAPHPNDFAPGPHHRVTIEKQVATSEQGLHLVRLGEDGRA
jgi:hypothetical protein